MNRRAAAALLCLVAAGARGDEGDTSPPPVDVFADRAGRFVLADPSLAGRVFAGPGVPCVVGSAGRIEHGAPSPRVWLRAADGTFDAALLRIARRDDDTAVRALRDAASALVAGFGAPFERSTAPYCGDRATMVHAAAAPSPGADLIDRATYAGVFVRFRSVESAYRFSDLADRLGGVLLVAGGDGRDHATVRRVLDSLTLPEIWVTNPEGVRGVSECAFATDLAPTRGDRRGAALFRVVDAELHRMQTVAGLGSAAHEGRESAVRRALVDGDVEIVANTAIGGRPSGVPPGEVAPIVAAWRDLRVRFPAAPDEAFLLVTDPRARRGAPTAPDTSEYDADERAAREAAGWLRRLRAWCGLNWESMRGWARATPVPADVLRRVAWARCVTDDRGATVSVAFDDEESAERARAALRSVSRPESGAAADATSGGAAPESTPRAAAPTTTPRTVALATVCATNRRDLAPLAVLAPDTHDVAATAAADLGWRPVCPCGGEYVAHPITREVSCSLHGTDGAPRPDPPAPKPLVRDVVRDGAIVRFRVRIDW